MKTVDHLIGGAACADAISEGKLYNPSTGEAVGSVCFAGGETTDRAIDVAAASLPAWSATGLQYRADLFLAVRQLMIECRDELVDIVMTEAGKTKPDAFAEVTKGIEVFALGGALGSWFKTGLTRNVAGGVDTYNARYPIGVVTAVAPFNFPIMVSCIHAMYAIACGNTVVIKPSEKVPTAFRRIADLFKQAGFPDGVLNVVNGGREAVERFVEHPSVAAIAFVGSTPVAKHLRAAGVANGKRVQAFGSGKNHMIVLPDANLDMCADAAVSAAFGAAGQRCMAISVLVAVGDIGDALVAKIQERIPGINVGSARREGVMLGPVISGESLEGIHGFVEGAAAEGATVVTDGRESASGDGGFITGPSLVDHVKPGMKIYEQEVFGPVLSVVRVEDFEQAMALIDGHAMGNGAAIFTCDGGAAREFVDRVQAGSVGVNVPIPVATFTHGFGGWKDSGFSDHQASGPQAVDFYTKIKAVTTRWPDPAMSSVNLGFSTTS